MKRFKRLICLVLALCLVLPFTACGGSDLEAPTGIELDENYLLTWEEVAGARSYEVEITEAVSGIQSINPSRRTSYSLAVLDEGDYTVRLRSVGGKQNDDYSDWTKGLEFHKEYESGLIYTLINGNTEYEVTKVGRATGDLVIEDTYRGKPVTAIASSAFRSAGSRLTSVVIGNNVRTIGESAFYNCTGLKTVKIPDSVVSIGESAFQNCTALETVEMSDSVLALPNYVFAHCTALKALNFPASLVSIGDSAFTTCTSLTALDFPASLVSIGEYAFNENDSVTEVTFGENIETVSYYAFYGCDALAEIHFPDSLAEGASLALGNYAFAACKSLTDVVLPDGAESIGAGCFSYCDQFADVTIPRSVVSVGQSAFTETALVQAQEASDVIYADDWLLSISDGLFETLEVLDSTVLYADTFGIADQAFIRVYENGSYSGCPNLRRIDLLGSVRYIGKFAFANSPKLTELFCERGGLRKVDNYAFALCQVLSNVRFSNGLLEIGQYCFAQCDLLYNNPQNPHLLIPETVTRVGTSAFMNSGLWENPSADGVVYAGNWVVGYTGTGGNIELQDEIDGIGDYAFYNASELRSVQGLYRARRIGVGAFCGCESLSTVSLGSAVTTIGAYTFYGCSALYRITFPTVLTTIDRYAFYKCVSLNSIDLSGCRVTTIANRAFYDCGLTSVDLGSSLQTIGTRAFYNCINLEEVTIPGSVKTIGAESFAKCDSLSYLTLEEGIETIGVSAFRQIRFLGGIRIPNSVKEIGDAAFYGAVFNDSIDLGNGVERIGAFAFGYNQFTIFEDLVIPASVKEIGEYAFTNCSFRTVIFRGNVEKLGMHAFYGCINTVFYASEGVELPQENWNSSFRPVFSGCTLSDDGTYVTSIQTGKVQYATALGRNPSVPNRSGFDFVGWATEEGGEAVYGMEDLSDLPEGLTLYAVYRYHVSEEPAEGESSQTE